MKVKTNILKQNEVLDDLELDNLMIIQDKNGYKFSTDSVLLSNFATAKPDSKYIDLCSGSGVVAILFSYKNKIKNAVAVEIQPQVADRAKRSVAYNNLNIEVLNIDLKLAPQELGAEVADIITVNPPYNKIGETSKTDEIALSTHEFLVGIDDISSVSAKLLKFGGKLLMVHRADRLVEIFSSLTKNGLEPKRLQIVYPKLSKEPNLVLIEAKKSAKTGLKILKPLVLMNEDGTETDELKKIYGRNS